MAKELSDTKSGIPFIETHIDENSDATLTEASAKSYLLIILVFLLIFGFGFIFVCSESRGSPGNPVAIPPTELINLRDAKAWSSSDNLFVSLDNQTDWFLTSIEIAVRKKNPNDGFCISRNYIGTPPPSYVIEKRKREVCPIHPKSSGKFIFNIGSFLSSKRIVENYKTEYVYKPFEWNIVAANGYKMQ